MEGITKENIGFIFEVLLFVVGGFIVSINLIVGFSIIVLGILMALVVGKQIKENSIEEHRGMNK